MPNKYTLTKKQVVEYFTRITNATIYEAFINYVKGISALEEKFNHLQLRTQKPNWDKIHELKLLIINRIEEVVRFVYEELGKGEIVCHYFENANSGDVGEISKEILNDGWLQSLKIVFDVEPTYQIHIHSSFLYMTNEEIQNYMKNHGYLQIKSNKAVQTGKIK